MRNIALIFAGGVGNRMNSKARPKQFLEIHGKPIIIHTLDHFEENQQVDAICVVCVETWLDYMNQLVERFRIKKVKWLVSGGETAMESQYNGLKAIYQDCLPGERVTVLIHDGVRPMITQQLIDDCIESVNKHGSAITVAPQNETIVKLQSDIIVDTVSRAECMIARAPQCFFLHEILQQHEKARKEGMNHYIDSASMMLSFGHEIHVVNGPAENIKVTTPADFYICRALMDARENSQIYGI